MTFGIEDYDKVLCKIWFTKSWGRYRRNGKVFIRNYHRELKNGKGFSIMDHWQRMQTPFYDRFMTIKKPE